MLVARSKFPSFWFKGEIRWFFWWEADWRLFVHKLIFERLDVYSLVQNDLQNPLWFYTSWTSWLLHVINCIKVNTEWVEKMSNYQSILCLSDNFNWYHMKYCYPFLWFIPVADLGSNPGKLPPKYLDFMQFFRIFCKIVCSRSRRHAVFGESWTCPWSNWTSSIASAVDVVSTLHTEIGQQRLLQLVNMENWMLRQYREFRDEIELFKLRCEGHAVIIAGKNTGHRMTKCRSMTRGKQEQLKLD